jgi:hypothetical protein
VTVTTIAVNPALAAPEGTVTLPGTVAFPLSLERATAMPPLGATPLKVTVQADVPGAFTLEGEQETPVRVTFEVRLMVEIAVWAFSVAVTVAVTLPVTEPAVAVNVPLLALPAMVMLAGTLSNPLLLDKPTVTALVVALFRLTVQVAVWLVPNVPGVQLRLDSWAGETNDRENVREVLLAVAVMVAV